MVLLHGYMNMKLNTNQEIELHIDRLRKLLDSVTEGNVTVIEQEQAIKILASLEFYVNRHLILNAKKAV